jgi:hypothetical protein
LRKTYLLKVREIVTLFLQETIIGMYVATYIFPKAVLWNGKHLSAPALRRELQIRIAAPAPDSFKKYLENYLF